MKEKVYRSVIKTISYRIFGTTATTLIIFFVTHKFIFSLGIGVIDLFIKIVLFYVHERVWNKLSIGKVIILGQEPLYSQSRSGAVLWFTGLSGSGKSTLANKLAKYLNNKSIANELLDGDNFREYVTIDLGFSKEDRIKNIKLAGYVSKILSKHGLIVIATFISPYKELREQLRAQIPNFNEIFVNSPLEICEARDVKGLYKKARGGEITSFTGVSDIYESPVQPDLELHTDKFSEEECVGELIKFLEDKKIIERLKI